MYVRKVAGSSGPSYTVLGADGLPIGPVESFLAHLVDVERSPNTVRGYAFDLRDWRRFLDATKTRWTDVSEELVGQFAASLRWAGPPVAAERRNGPVGVSSATMARKLAALSSFYDFHARHGVELRLLRRRTHTFASRPATSFRPFLHHVTRDRPRQSALLGWRRERPSAPATLSGDEVRRLLAACACRRDRLLVALLYDTGVRIGEALGLRHEDLDPRHTSVRVAVRDNPNGARAKSGPRLVPASAALFTLYNDYLDLEYGELDSDFVFANLWGGARGLPMTYPRAVQVLRRLADRSEVTFTAHTLRHTYATDLLRRGVATEVVSKLLGHAQVTTTSSIYAHLSVDDLRRALQAVSDDRARVLQ